MKAQDFIAKKVLITVKAYPYPSISYGETVCCAGVDLEDFKWIRLYPIPFRDLEDDKKFRKYSIIEADCAKSPGDLRPESYRIRSASIRILDHIDTRKGWDKRKSIVLNLPVKSMCQVIEDEKNAKASLGLIKPVNIAFHCEKKPKSDAGKRMKAYAQKSLFGRLKQPIEEIPYQFYYHFRCASELACPSHDLSITDWEICQSFRRWKYRYRDEQELLRKIEDKWMDMVDDTKKDSYFYVGNLHRLQNIFTVLGTFYPPLMNP
ncbi:MAG: hypothetical protein ABSG73_11180 [Candidatus Aminicenantales bacterium]